MTDRTAWGRPRPTRRTAAGPQALPAIRGRAWALLRRRAVQRGIRAAIAAGLAWQVAVRMPPLLSDSAYYAPLGAVIAVHPTVAGAAWRTVLGFALAVQIAPPIRPGQGPVAVSGSPAVPLALPPRCARSPRGCMSTELDEEQRWRRDCRL